ncbi:MAG: RDD family protein [Verrucomicrobiaceae bacterium]|nr:RDD family protein [Verrucomicrobiaceae bacterium]
MTATALTDTLQAVELADGVEIHLRVAGPAVRSAAWLIDLIVFIGIMIGGGMLMAFVSAWTGAEIGQGLHLIFLFLSTWFYNVFFEMGAKGASPGQRTMGLKVASVSGAPVRLPQSIIRNLLRVVDFMPFGYLLGFTCCLFTKKFQRLGDLVADTVVIYADDRKRITAPVRVNAEPVPPPAPLLREEQAALAQFNERAPLWSDARKIELTDILEPLTRVRGLSGLAKTAGMTLWLQGRK